MAGPQYRQSGTIRLRVVPGGFATVREPDLRVEGTDLVAAERVPLDGRTCADLAATAGVDAGVPEGLYHDHSGVPPEEPLRVDPAAAAHLATCFEAGDAALRAFAAAAGSDATPVLWPEHFDLGVTLDEVNYGRAVRLRRPLEGAPRRVLERPVRRGTAVTGTVHCGRVDPLLHRRPGARGHRPAGLTVRPGPPARRAASAATGGPGAAGPRSRPGSRRRPRRRPRRRGPRAGGPPRLRP